MLCRRNGLYVFPSGIALEKDLPMNLIGVDYYIYWCCFWDRCGCRDLRIPLGQILSQVPEGLGCTPGSAVPLRPMELQCTYL